MVHANVGLGHEVRLYLLGFMQPFGSTIPLVEVQRWGLTSVLVGDNRLPTREVMQREIDAHPHHKIRRYVNACIADCAIFLRSAHEV